jgi:hypothetical protein
MPITYVVDKTCGQIRTTVTGPITVKEILAHFETAQREQLLSFTELIDAREAAKPYLSPTDLWNAASVVRNAKLTSAPAPRAVIVDNSTVFGLVRIFTTILSGHIPINVFQCEKSAMEWLTSQPQPHRPIQPPPTTKSS